MSLSYIFGASQGKDGSPLNLHAGARASELTDSMPWWGIGIKTSSGAPATFAALARWDGEDGISDAFWDRTSASYRWRYAGGVQTLGLDSQEGWKRKTLDADYAVGRYLWLACFGSGTPAGGDVPIHVVGGYLIR